ncbi:UNVERIFIED_CONTAM: hypothetical protein Slati_4272000 [Sesamum latifolium]|uniref:Uncharacterized protein n=1 Tax=Sesamum latifolium TaxID=2727402 RepID=A0AAW2TFW2_9LAMI
MMNSDMIITAVPHEDNIVTLKEVEVPERDVDHLMVSQTVEGQSQQVDLSTSNLIDIPLRFNLARCVDRKVVKRCGRRGYSRAVRVGVKRNWGIPVIEEDYDVVHVRKRRQLVDEETDLILAGLPCCSPGDCNENFMLELSGVGVPLDSSISRGGN